MKDRSVMNKVTNHKIILICASILLIASVSFIVYLNNGLRSSAKINAYSKDNLQYHRQKIDAIDKQILKLLSERAEEAQKIAVLKKEHKLPIYVPKREEEVLNNLQKQNHGPLADSAISRIFTMIMKEMRELEKNY